ncbi:MAG TPA: hypothetical protein PLU35_03400 [Phycisphaerales bacterium]|nr:hypothetical protein [Phycisphaerales bacterium]
MLHRARLIVVFVLVGVVANVPVAWGCAAFAPLPLGHATLEDNLSTSWVRFMPEDIGAPTRAFRATHAGATHWQLHKELYEGASESNPRDVHVVNRWAFGFPTRSLYVHAVWSPVPTPGVRPTWKAGIRFTPNFSEWMMRAGRANMGALPIAPLWGGFAINAAFYAIIAGMLWMTYKRTRAMKRLRSGLCVHCGYDARSLAVCPECGHACATSTASRVARDAGGG